MSNWRIPLFTILALIAFAANSVLNRLALGNHTIDASSYTGIRLVAGALTLWVIHSISKQKMSFPLVVPLSTVSKWANLHAAFYLFLYGITFSFAYSSLSAGTGAFILFGTVQITLLTTLLLRGERPQVAEWAGLMIALSGLIYLVFPGLSAPNPEGALLMITAGIAWGGYTLKGKGVQDPLETTTRNFMLSVPMVVLVYLFSYSKSYISTEGVLYALLSGSVASGIGYVIWYAALKGLTTTQAALLQLAVPIIAAFGGIVLLKENITMRLIVAGILILGGVVLALMGKKK
jgi:drug/metabolite transporter (DMT)-like permease